MTIIINNNNDDPLSIKRPLKNRTQKLIKSEFIKRSLGLFFLIAVFSLNNLNVLASEEDGSLVESADNLDSVNLEKDQKIELNEVINEIPNKSAKDIVEKTEGTSEDNVEKIILLSKKENKENNSEVEAIKEVVKENEEKSKRIKVEEQEKVVAKELKELLKDHPMEDMADIIAKEDGEVIAFIVAIGKKESNWGKRSPSKDGKDCYNYWGFKTSGSRGQALGHACFGSREEAVDKIAKRLKKLVKDDNRNTPEKMLVWKCGSSCKDHDSASVQKWVSDVKLYRDKVFDLEHFKDYKLDEKTLDEIKKAEKNKTSYSKSNKKEDKKKKEKKKKDKKKKKK